MKKRILVVDDDRSVAEVLSDILAFSNYDVKAITRGEIVFKEIDSYQPDLILLDVMLSGMDGRMICKSIKTSDKLKDIPVILLSAYMSSYPSVFEQNGPDDFVLKPFDISFLLRKVDEQLAA